MSQPTPYVRTTSFTNTFAANPTQVFPGPSLDAELNNAKATLDQVLANLALAQNDDGSIKNGSIGQAQLSAALNIGFTVPTAWAQSTAYLASPASTVFANNKFYSCLKSHTSSASFTTDLAAGDWVLIADLTGIPLQTATQVSVTPAGNITQANVQLALQQLDTLKAPATYNTLVASNITDSGAAGRTVLQQGTTDAILAALGSWSTGDVKLTLKTVADAGWVMANDGTIGSAASGATALASATAQALYLLIYNNIADADAPVTGGRGVSGIADFNNNKPMALTKMLGRTLAVAGSGSGLTARALGHVVGEETHQLTTAELATHNHGITDTGHGHGVTDPGHQHGIQGNNALGATGNTAAEAGAASTTALTSVNATGISIVSGATGISVNNAGSGTAHNNMQPTSFFNVMIKL